MSKVQTPPRADHKNGRRVRVAMYSHDTMGLGHIRRNLLIAQTLEAQLDATVLVLSGAAEAAAFHMPCGVDCVTLPSLYKQANRLYRSRRLRVPSKTVIRLRSATIRAAIEAFRPDVFIADKVPRGARGELDATLRYLNRKGRTRCILGLRDIIDQPATVQREWQRDGNDLAVREYYDAVWFYGDLTVCDPAREYRFASDITEKMSCIGYLDQTARLGVTDWEALEQFAHLVPTEPFVLCVVGGGQDGFRLAEAFLQTSLPDHMSGVIVAGPSMPPAAFQQLNQRAAGLSHFHVFGFVREVDHLMQQAEAVIGMGGYNTVCSILSFKKRALIVPRVSPRQEQLIRAQRLGKLGVIDMLHPRGLSPAALSQWLHSDAAPWHPDCNGVDMKGLDRLPQLVEAMVNKSSRAMSPVAVKE